MNNSPLLSVCFITYNHEKFIKESLESVLNQKTNFSYEIVIGEDFSTDGTRSIVCEYLKKYPEIIRVITTEYNVGPTANVFRTLESCKGNYIAALEGDDYWTDPLKLQKQVDFLEQNPGINLCFHQVNYVDTHNKDLGNPQYNMDKPQFLSYEYLIEFWVISTCSVVFRKFFEEVPAFLNDYKVGDQPLFYFINMGKPYYYFSDIMSSYRITDTGATGIFLKKELKSDIEFPFLDKINELSDNKYSKVIKRRKGRTVIKDLKFMKTTGKYKFVNRAKFYFKNLFFLLNYQRGIKVSVYCFFKYVI